MMKDIRWLVNRLRAMHPQEVIWRLQQKLLQKKEQHNLYSLHKPVYEIPLSDDISHLHIDINKLCINWDNRDWECFSSLDLFGVFKYEDYKYRWNAGFQTENTWPEELFSPTINIIQRVDIGDVRTNWELNRHFQFAALAKSYYCTSERKYLEELKMLFSDWNQHNLFLHGIEWQSAMEVAIRVNSWVYAFAFLKKSGCEESILNEIEHGILVMSEYILMHRARFSSANNHLIVEMYAVALVGILADYASWRDEALRILTEELPKQNYSDGVNKEMSLHYQSFVMEAYGLLWLLMLKNNIEIPQIWKQYLTAMSEFVTDSTDDFGTTMEFGDSDEGKILDLNGVIGNHYAYVLALMGCILDEYYTDADWHENLQWIIPAELRESKKKYTPSLVCIRKKGGYTFLRSKDRRVLIGIDHADLGFGSIAAHGHADALSFQMHLDGQRIFVDSGTYNYHITPEDRNYFRSTAAHNTVMIDEREQSEMLGPFIWGKKAKTQLVKVQENEDVEITMRCDNESGNHVRTLVFNGSNHLTIIDDIGNAKGKSYYHLAQSKCRPIDSNTVEIENNGKIVTVISNAEINNTREYYSSKYLHKCQSNTICVGFSKSLIMKFEW